MSDTIEQLAREFAALNTATERAHAAIADMRSARAELRETIQEARTLAQQIGTVTALTAENLIGEEVGRQLDALTPAIKAQIERSENQILRRFDQFERALLGDDVVKPSIETMIVERAAASTRNGRPR